MAYNYNRDYQSAILHHRTMWSAAIEAERDAADRRGQWADYAAIAVNHYHERAHRAMVAAMTALHHGFHAGRPVTR